MSSPRTAAYMLDKFGLDAESLDDERCLLINPAVWRVAHEKDEEALSSVPFVDCVMEKEELGMGVDELVKVVSEVNFARIRD